MARYIAASVDEVPPGGRKIVELDGRSIGIFNVGGEFFALRNRCPHQGGPLCLGPLEDHVEAATPGEYAYDADRKMVRCPWHAWEFDLRTGQSWFDPERTRVRGYDVRVERGATQADAQVPSAGLQPGPYTAETFTIFVDRDYVVVDVPS